MFAGKWVCASALLLACVAPLHAQVSGSVGVVSDYRYRGHSLSAGDPAVQADIEWNAARGPYAGVFVSSGRSFDERGAFWIPYIGHAWRDGAGHDWDIGARWMHFSADTRYDHPEVHVGLALRDVAFRLHYAHAYFGDASALYAEADGSVRITDRVRLLLHAGATHDVGGGQGVRIDVRAGASLRTAVCEISLAWQGVQADDLYARPYPPWDPNDRQAWVLGCTHRW